MEWFSGRHFFFVRTQDVAIAVSVIQFILYCEIGISNEKLDTTIGAAALFVCSLCSFVLVRALKLSLPSLEPLVLPFVTTFSIASGQVHAFSVQTIQPHYFLFFLLLFLQTGYPLIVLLLFALIGILIGVSAQFIVENTLQLEGVTSTSEWTEYLIPLFYIVLCAILYNLVYQFAIEIVRHKSNPVRSIKIFADLVVLERLVLPPAYSSNRHLMPTNDEEMVSAGEESEKPPEPSPLEQRITTVTPLNARKVRTMYTMRNQAALANQDDETTSRKKAQKMAEKLADKLPGFVVSVLNLFDNSIKSYTRKRYMMEKATWKRKPYAMPEINYLGVFINEKIEGWYLQWMQAFNCSIYYELRWLYPLLVIWQVLFVMISKLRVNSAMTQVNYKELPRYADVGPSILRLSLQLGVQLTLCGPLFFGGKRIANVESIYKLTQLQYMNALATFAFAMWDSGELAYVPLRYQGRFSVLSYPSIGIILGIFFLLCRVPIVMVHIVSMFGIYNIMFWLTFRQRREYLLEFLSGSIHYLLAGAISVLFFTRSLEINRRRIFVKFVLPYMCYLEEAAIIIYAGVDNSSSLN